MIRFGRYLRKWFARNHDAPDDQEAHQLRITFKDRYHHFKLLLGANTQALQRMADIEQALQGHDAFGMAFVRDRCTATAVCVSKMINHIERLAPRKYSLLQTRFAYISEQINATLAAKSGARTDKLVLPLSANESAAAEIAGNKMANLAALGKNPAFTVPPGFVITTHAYERFLAEAGLRDEINRLTQTADLDDVEQLYGLSAQIRQKIVAAPFPEEIAEAIHGAWTHLAKQTSGRLRVALRSSAIGEDSADMSFAGQYDSELNVEQDDLLDAYRRIVASKYNLHAIVYRLKHGMRDEEIPMAVGCLRMIDALAGGVIYTRNPLATEDDGVIIHSVWGLPKTVVDGTAPCDLFLRDREPPHRLIRQEIADKTIQYAACDSDSGLCRVSIDAQRAAMPAIDEAQQLALTAIALEIETHYGNTQDIEWAIDADGTIVILQSRPLRRQQADGSAQPASITDQQRQSIIVEGGVAASSGTACGDIFVVKKRADTLRFPRGSVLVARQALPAWATLLNRAAAVVTAQGGMAGHLASVAREFGIPALFGLPGALEKLATGDQVTVDADNQRIYAGRIDALLREQRATRPKMADRPVYRIMKQASRWIVPLNLLDPDDKSFTPGNCDTYHDITRFIHEKAVYEMFNFGKNHQFPERSGKQLHFHVPMQWWVLNLDDGFKAEVSGKYVKLDNIICVPMLAFWDGFAAVPWDGPPAIDGKGLMAVMFQSTTNPALVTGVRSRYAEQNYFMISKHFCSLNSRLGYHFCTLESLVGDRIRGNYISFQFKGGAADDHRRKLRAVFIGEILETYGFSVKIRQDHLSARLQEEALTYMSERLAILGYLTLHTRQLDMIMNNEKQVAYYKSKLLKDIDKQILRQR